MPEENVTPMPAVEGDQPPEPAVLFYVLSFLVPMAGIVLGAIFLTKKDAANKKFGKNCLICGLIPIVLYFMCMIGLVLFYIAFFLFYIIFILVLVGAAGAGALKTALALTPFLC